MPVLMQPPLLRSRAVGVRWLWAFVIFWCILSTVRVHLRITAWVGIGANLHSKNYTAWYEHGLDGLTTCHWFCFGIVYWRHALKSALLSRNLISQALTWSENRPAIHRGWAG